jgi:mannose/fructose/N-acetylgalactosamine-specific phosphotransferase system component IIC
VEVFLISLLFAFICLDKKHAFQFAISQPLITSSLLGLLMNALAPAMYFGTLIQLLWLGNLPFGASRTPEGNIASVVGCWLYIEYYQLYAIHGQFIILILFIYIVIISYTASKTDTYMRNFNIRLFDYTYAFVINNTVPNLGKTILAALGLQFFVNWVLIYLGLLLGKVILSQVINYIPPDWKEIWQFVEVAVWAAGLGLVISVYKDIKLKKIIAGIALITLITIQSI